MAKAGFLSSLDGSESLAVLVGSLLATTGWSPQQRPPYTEQVTFSSPLSPLTQLPRFFPSRQPLETQPLLHVLIRVSFWWWPKREMKGRGPWWTLNLWLVRATESRARTEGRRGTGGERLGSGHLEHLLTEVWFPVAQEREGGPQGVLAQMLGQQ